MLHLGVCMNNINWLNSPPGPTRCPSSFVEFKTWKLIRLPLTLSHKPAFQTYTIPFPSFFAKQISRVRIKGSVSLKRVLSSFRFIDYTRLYQITASRKPLCRCSFTCADWQMLAGIGYHHRRPPPRISCHRESTEELLSVPVSGLVIRGRV